MRPAPNHRSRILGAGFVLACSSAVGLAQLPVPLYAAPNIPAVPAPAAAVSPAAPSVQPSAKPRSERLAAEVAELERRRDDSLSRLKQRSRALYRLRRLGVVPVEGGFQGLLARAGRLERLERVIIDDADRYRSLKQRVAATRAELERARAEERRIEEDAARTEAARAAVEAQLGYADLGLPAVDALPIAAMPSVDVAQLSAPAAPSTSGFALLRGRLGMPVTTTLGVRDAVRDDGPGLEFLARPGTTVMTVAEGRVAFAGEYGSYGRMVILDHGDTFYTIYAGLGRITARVGDFVARGGVLGEIGGGATPALFFEVRRGTRSLDTRNWVGLAARP